MFASLLVALAASAAVQADVTEPAFKTPPAWLRKPTPAQLLDAWPAEAFRKHVEGKVELNCQVSIEGLAENCKVVSEAPTGLGFGSAALLLTPTLLFKPAVGVSGPVRSSVNIPIAFKTDGAAGDFKARGAGTGPGPGLTSTRAILHDPVWATAPSFADLATAYPRQGSGRAFYLAFRCDVVKDGSLAHCDIKQSEPHDGAAEAAARTLIPRFRLDPTGLDAGSRERPRTDVAIRLIDPSSAEFRERRISEPMWVTVVDQKAKVSVYPPQAAAKGVRTGLGIATCHVQADGALTACVPGKADPEGLGFSEAAVTVASVMRMRRWTQGGGPVDDAVINLPIRLNLSPSQPPPANGAPAPAPSGSPPT